MGQQLPQQMQAVEISKPGAPQVLRLTTRPVPALQAGEILIKVTTAGVNGPDLMQRKGLYPAPPGAPDLPGLEVSGEIVAAGAQVQRWKVGDRVTALTNGGGYAEFCAVDAQHCLPVPHGVSLRDAGSLPETFFTVWSNVFMGAGLAARETLLVHGGAGGIGATAIQIAKATGARVIATDSPEARCDFCRALGADRVIDYRIEDFVEITRAEGGANVILDIVGGPNIEKNFKAATHDGRIIQLAFALGSKVDINMMPVMLKRLRYTGSTLRTRSADFKAAIARELEAQVWPLIAAGKIKPVVNAAFPLAAAAEAHALMESSSHLGKIILTVDS